MPIKKTLILVCAAAAALLAGGSAEGSPTQVTLHLAGIHKNGVDHHEGTFTSGPPLCAEGTWVAAPLPGTRRIFTCTDGSGTFTVTFDSVSEHLDGQVSPWVLIEGTGRYETLRGKGDGATTATPTDDPPTWLSTWQGTVDFDNVAPTLTSFKAKARKLRRPAHTYLLSVNFSAADNVADNAVSYHFTAHAGSRQVAKKTGASSKAVALSFKVKPGRVRKIDIEIALTDPIGNERVVTRHVRLPG